MVLTTPYSIQIELVQGCNRSCTFCGINSYVDEAWKSMSIATMTGSSIQCREFIPLRRYELAMHGEPTLHPNLNIMIEILRAAVPKAQIQMTTNGSKIGDNATFVKNLFKSGLDFLIVDMYESDRLRILEMIKETSSNTDIKIVDFYSTDSINPYQNYKRKLSNTIILMDDLGKRTGTKKNRVLTNLAGNSKDQPWPSAPLQKPCTNMFREISVCYDGSVNICCMDFAHEYTCGNVNERSLSDIWYGKEFTAARKFIRNKKRYFSPCARCNYNGGGRQGLLPKIEEPTVKDVQVIRTVLKESKHNNDLPILDFIGKKPTDMKISKGKKTWMF